MSFGSSSSEEIVASALPSLSPPPTYHHSPVEIPLAISATTPNIPTLLDLVFPAEDVTPSGPLVPLAREPTEQAQSNTGGERSNPS